VAKLYFQTILLHSFLIFEETVSASFCRVEACLLHSRSHKLCMLLWTFSWFANLVSQARKNWPWAQSPAGMCEFFSRTSSGRNEGNSATRASLPRRPAEPAGSRRHDPFVTICLTVLMGLGTFFAVPFVRPFQLSVFLCTYFIPILPAVMWIDGMVSCLRAYSLLELRQLCAGVSAPDDRWLIGNIRMPGLWVTITYVLGCPEST
jgi:hypothetical protein